MAKSPLSKSTFTRKRVLNTVALVIIAAVLSAIIYVALPGASPTTITAEFKSAPGLYVGNHVDVLGMPVGTVESVKAEPSMVLVKMEINAGQKVPSDVKAIIMAPSVVNDRYVELTPAYTGGAHLDSGGHIPLNRTAAPIDVEQVFNSLDSLAKGLGPTAANKNGALKQLLTHLAATLGPNGANLHSAISNSSNALAGLASNPKALTSLLSNLGQLTELLSKNTTSYTAFAQDFASVSASLASDNADTAAALHNLQIFFSNLNNFIHQNSSSLGTSLNNLGVFATKLASEQKALGQSLDTGPLALQNLSAAIDPSATGGAALAGRLDGNPSTKSFLTQICGSTLLRGLVIATNPSSETTMDMACLFSGSLGSLPSASTESGPNLTLQNLLAGESK